MTEHNHHRGTSRKRAYDGRTHRAPRDTFGGFAPPTDKPWGYIDKSMHGTGQQGKLSGKRIGASIGNDFTNGHRGMANAVRGAKKFVRTRIRFHENAATRRLAREDE